MKDGTGFQIQVSKRTSTLVYRNIFCSKDEAKEWAEVYSGASWDRLAKVGWSVIGEPIDNKYYKMLEEISAWLSFNNAPNRDELRDMKADIDKTLNT